MKSIASIASPLYVITCISNPMRYRTRYEHYREFEKYIADSGAILYTIEQSYRNRAFEITQDQHPRHFRVTTSSELWYKENLLNIVMQRLPRDWEYVAWIDADVTFARPDWVDETIHQLQHYPVVQLFSQAMDLDPNHRLFNVQRDGFVYGWIKNNRGPISTRYRIIHPGYAWAARRESINALGGLIDWAIVGSADWHMACALVGQVEKSLLLLHDQCPVYIEWCNTWAKRAADYLRYDIGYVDGLIFHHWHGTKKSRGYDERWKILTNSKFDPTVDLKRDWQGLWQLTDNNHQLRDALRAYFSARSEDSIDI